VIDERETRRRRRVRRSVPALMSAKEIEMDWKKIRKALKDGGATLRAGHFGNYWIELPVDPKIARQIVAHPAVVLSDESDRYETYRWRSRSESPARKALQARGVR
jgi:hypothetical protein